jgi:hypothetical protein
MRAGAVSRPASLQVPVAHGPQVALELHPARKRQQKVNEGRRLHRINLARGGDGDDHRDPRAAPRRVIVVGRPRSAASISAKKRASASRAPTVFIDSARLDLTGQ